MSFEPGVWIDPAEEYEQAAEFCAKVYGRVISPQWVKALIECPDRVEEAILANPEEWYRRVNDYLYAIYMGEK